MNVLIVNSSDIRGGAARAAYRLHQGLRALSINSTMLVQKKDSGDLSVLGSETGSIAKVFDKLRRHIQHFPLHFYRNRHPDLFSLNWLWNDFDRKVEAISSDIIHLHWICDDFVPVSSLAKIKSPMIWTLHDCWPFTGGCHYPYECGRYQEDCGTCLHLGSKDVNDLSRRLLRQKARHWKKINLTVVTPSRWLAECAKSSSLFRDMRVEVIPNGLDLNRFKPIEPSLARNILNLPPDKLLILFGALNPLDDRRKGFHLIQTAIQRLKEYGWENRLELVVCGSSVPVAPFDFGFKTRYLGHLHDDFSLALLYSAADVMVVPSIQENLPNTATESLACGTPVVAFDIGGLKDIIDHQENGYLAKPLETEDLARGIEWVLSSNNHRQHALRLAARRKAECDFDINIVAKRYLALYESLINLVSNKSESYNNNIGWRPFRSFHALRRPATKQVCL